MLLSFIFVLGFNFDINIVISDLCFVSPSVTLVCLFNFNLSESISDMSHIYIARS